MNYIDIIVIAAKIIVSIICALFIYTLIDNFGISTFIEGAIVLFIFSIIFSRP